MGVVIFALGDGYVSIVKKFDDYESAALARQQIQSVAVMGVRKKAYRKKRTARSFR